MVLLSTEWESIMSTNLVLLIVAGMLMLTVIIMHVISKRLAKELYHQMVECTKSEGANVSPYTIRREYSTYAGCDYYYIYKGNQRLDTQLFREAKAAQTSMNELEQLGGYKKTKVI